MGFNDTVITLCKAIMTFFSDIVALPLIARARRNVFILCAWIASTPVFAALDILACEPEWAALAKTLGGDHVRVVAATTAAQDPHHIQARPSLIAAARRADLLVCTGAELEAGWLPLLLQRSGNPHIQPGQPGYFMAADHVALLEVRTRVDRSEGDVHAAGNPHIHTDPRNMLAIAVALANRLADVDEQNAAHYRAAQNALAQQMQQLLDTQAATINALRGKRIAVHHNAWPYLVNWLGLQQVGTVEPKPGVPPGSAHLSALVQQLQGNTDYILYANHQDGRAAKWLSERLGVPAIALPATVPDWEQPDALVRWYRELLELQAAVQ